MSQQPKVLPKGAEGPRTVIVGGIKEREDPQEMRSAVGRENATPQPVTLV